MVQNHRKPLKAMVARPKTIEKPLIAMVRPPKNIQWWWSPPKPLKISNGLLKTIDNFQWSLKNHWNVQWFPKIIQLDLVSSNQWNSQCSLKRMEISSGHNITHLDCVFWSCFTKVGKMFFTNRLKKIGFTLHLQRLEHFENINSFREMSRKGFSGLFF